MKAKFFFLLALTMLLQTNTLVSAREMADSRQIEFNARDKGAHRSLPIVPEATIENSLVSIDFLVMVPSVTITIRNAETNEVIYSAVETDIKETLINLGGEDEGRYIIEMETRDAVFTGEFEIILE